jgi:hypothetical protein
MSSVTLHVRDSALCCTNTLQLYVVRHALRLRVRLLATAKLKIALSVHLTVLAAYYTRPLVDAPHAVLY